MDGSGFNFNKPELFKAEPKPGLAGRAGLAQHYTHVVPEAPIHWHCPTMFNIAPGTPLVATSGLEDDDDEDSEEIDQLDSDNEEDISDGTSQLDCIRLHC